MTKYQPIIRQGFLSAVKIIRDKGTVGLREELEHCYRKIARSHDQTALVYCVTQDRYGTQTTAALFPQMEDPYFNWDAFGSRAANATVEAVQPLSAGNTFIVALGAMQVEEMKSLAAGLHLTVPHE